MNESMAWLKALRSAYRRKRTRELVELLQVMCAGAGAPWGGKGAKTLMGMLEESLKAKG